MNRARSLHSGMCGLNDGSTADQWRLPTKDELRARAGNTSGFTNLRSGGYWSSNYYAYYVWEVYIAYTNVGYAYIDEKYKYFYVLPVRAAQ